ncbi:hypothetical protein SCHPADRAFT_945815 [Schizopora paradoxa]|uniref:Sugar phosphate transporter domain-containing protein n=1 Tax=Schizopora paradoxa TaxID=27342 RepID=A0A0H2R4M1_9AGAM|nr:hypothetical protein SCHPADRAFT_945815 [Schizopora paradoxa]
MPAPQSSTPAQVAGVVSFYMTAALVMVFVNKAVLNSSPDLPLLFLFLQMIIAVVLLHLTAALFPKRVDLPNLNMEAAKKLTPVVAVNIIGLVFNTLCLRDVDASFFQIARGMVLPMTIAASSMSTRSTPSVRVLAAAGIVTMGFLLGISPASLMPSRFASANAQSTNVSFISLIYGLMSSLFIAVHSVLIKSSLPHCNGSTIHLAYWTNLGSAIFVAPFVVLKGEPWRVLDLLASNAHNGAVDVWNVRVFVIGSLVTGTFGFLLCVAGLLSIKVTSPITHMFSSAARSVFQTLLGVSLFGDILTINRATSILVILLGTMYYTWAKHVESSKPAAPALPMHSTSDSSSSSGRSSPVERKLRVSMDSNDEEILFDSEARSPSKEYSREKGRYD